MRVRMCMLAHAHAHAVQVCMHACGAVRAGSMQLQRGICMPTPLAHRGAAARLTGPVRSTCTSHVISIGKCRPPLPDPPCLTGCLPSPAALRAVTPPAGPPGSSVSLVGSYVWQQSQDCAAKNWGGSSCVGAALFGDYMCRQAVEDVTSLITFGNSARYGNGVYNVTCVLPSPSGSDSTQVGERQGEGEGQWRQPTSPLPHAACGQLHARSAGHGNWAKQLGVAASQERPYMRYMRYMRYA